jgi:hypothetical protein
MLIVDMSSFPILHRWYCQQPTLLLDVFPNLPPADLFYIPLGVSWTMTMLFLELSFGAQAFVQYLERRGQYKRDYLIANRFADYAEGESKVLVELEQYAIEQGVPDWDIGTTDKMYVEKGHKFRVIIDFERYVNPGMLSSEPADRFQLLSE